MNEKTMVEKKNLDAYLDRGNKRTIELSGIYNGTLETKFIVTYRNSILDVDNKGLYDSENTKNFIEPEQAKKIITVIRNAMIRYLDQLRLGNAIDDIKLKSCYGENDNDAE